MCSGVCAPVFCYICYLLVCLLPDLSARNRWQWKKAKEIWVFNVSFLPIKSQIAVLKLCFKSICCLITPWKKHTTYKNTRKRVIYAHTHARAHAEPQIKKSRCCMLVAPNTILNSVIAQQDANTHEHIIDTKIYALTVRCWQHARGCRDKAKQFINTRRLLCHRICGSCSVRFLLAFRLIPAAVRVQTHIFNVNAIPSLSRANPVPHTVTLFWPTSPNSSNSDLLLLQRSRRNPECSSKAPLTLASNCHRKANVSTVRTDQSRRGTYHVSATWAACLLMQNCSTVTSRSGTCRARRTWVGCSLVRHHSTATWRSGTCQA